MGDEVTTVLDRFRAALGTGAPVSAPTPSGTPAAVAAALRTTVGGSGAIPQAVNESRTTQAGISQRLIPVDPSLARVVSASQTDTQAARTAVDDTRTTYQSRVQQLQPVANTVGGQVGILNAKVTALQDGSDKVTGATDKDRLRKALVEALTRKIIAEQTAAKNVSGSSPAQAQPSSGQTPQMPSIGTGGGATPTQSASYNPKQIAAMIAILASAKKGGGNKTTTTAGGGSGTNTSGANSSGITIPGGSDKVSKVIASALQQRGKPYGWGATGPNAWDCSSLVQNAYKQAGVDLPRVTYDQINVGRAVSTPQPGDLVFNNFSAPGRPEHVQMYIGDGKVVEAPKPGDVVKISNYVASGSQIRRVFQ